MTHKTLSYCALFNFSQSNFLNFMLQTYCFIVAHNVDLWHIFALLQGCLGIVLLMYKFINEKIKSFHFTNGERVKSLTRAAEIIIAFLKLD